MNPMVIGSSIGKAQNFGKPNIIKKNGLPLVYMVKLMHFFKRIS